MLSKATTWSLGWLIVNLVEGPRALANWFGLYKTSFQIGDRLLTRPPEFRSNDEKAVFQRIGTQLANKAYYHGGLLPWLSDSEILESASTAQYPLEVWHRVLDFFVREECFVRYWRLRFTDRLGFKQTPRWNADGSPIKGLDDIHHRDPRIGELDFWPGRLTDEERQALLGTRYVSVQASAFGDEPAQEIILSADDFEIVYHQPPNLFLY